MEKATHEYLQQTAANIRLNALAAVDAAGSGHIGGSLSVADILTVLYFNTMQVDTNNPTWPDRDRLVLSKGHCSPALYATLAEKGFFPKEELQGFRQVSSRLSGHAELHVPGVDMSTGSLGQGLSVATGMALAARVDNKPYRVYTILGDGELEEGQVWEAAMCAGHYQLANLTAIVDNNNLQIDGAITEVMSPYPIDEKFRAFGWNVICVDGHNLPQLASALDVAKETTGKPTAIIAQTVKGKGVSFMENIAGWHGKPPSHEEYLSAAQEINTAKEALTNG